MDNETRQLLAEILTLIAELTEAVERIENMQLDARMQGNLRVRNLKPSLSSRVQSLRAKLNALPTELSSDEEG